MLKYTKPIIICASALLCAASALAVPARRDPMTVTQPDGSKITIVNRGDERNHALFTTDGYAVMSDDNGFFYYARPEGNRFIISDIRAHNMHERSAAELQYLQSLTLTQIDETFKARSLAANAKRINRLPATIAADADNDDDVTPIQHGPGTFDTTFPAYGRQKVLVILVEYNNVKFNQYNDSYYKYDDAWSYFYNMLNEPGYDKYGTCGSARDYFVQNSNGLFTPEFDVYGPVLLDHSMKYYGGNDSWGDDQNAAGMIVDACKALDSEIDFKDYDRDNDGFVDNVYVFYAGYGEADSQVANSIWPHSWTLEEAGVGALTLDDVTINYYACSNETSYYGGCPNGIGTFVHEFSHVLGLPDLYQTNETGNPFTPGAYSILDYGPYNNEGYTPPGYSAYERYAMGWMKPESFGVSGEYQLNNIAETNHAYKIDTDKKREFFLLENRQQEGWDEYIPGHGMLVWHVDALQTVFDNNSVNNNASHQYVDIIEADNNKTENTRAGDPFPGSSKVTTLGFTSIPTMRSWAGKDTGIYLTDIAEKDGVITLQVENRNENVGVKEIVTADGGCCRLDGNTIFADVPAEVYNAAGVKAGVATAEGLTLPSGLYIIALPSPVKILIK